MDIALVSLTVLSFCLVVSTWKLYKREGFKLCVLFCLLYAGSSILSIVFYYINSYLPFYVYDSIGLIPYIYWLGLFAITLYPVYKYEKYSPISLKYDLNIIHLFCALGLLVSIIPFLELLPEAVALFSGGADNVSDAITEMHDENEKEEKLSLIGSLLMRGVWAFYDISFIMILPLIKEKKKNIIAILGVVMVILTKNMETISTVSRTGLFNLALHAIVCFILFLPFLSAKEKKRVKRFGVIAVGFVAAIFLVITLARGATYQEKSSSGEYTSTVFVVRYGGEGFCNFGNFAFQAKQPMGGIYTLYVPQKLLGKEPPFVDRDYLYNVAESKQGIPQNVFYTYIGYFVLDLGPLWGAILLIAISLLAGSVCVVKGGMLNIATLFLFSVYLKILEFGPIGYVYVNKNSEYILLYLFIFVVMRVFSRKYTVLNNNGE